MEDLQPLDPKQAARELRKERNHNNPKPSTPTETGLAIASLAMGVLVAISAIPAGMLMSAQAAGTILVSLLAFAMISTVLGFIGRKNAMGIAGTALGIVALLETTCIFGCIAYQEQQERAKIVAQEKERTKQKEDEKRIEEIKLAQKQAETEALLAEARSKEAQLKIQQEQKNQENIKQTKEDELAAAETEKLRQEQFKKIDQERKDREAKVSLEQQQAAIARAQADRQRREEVKKEGLALVSKLQNAYPVALNDFQKVRTEVIRQREEASKSIEEAKGMKTRLNNVSDIARKLSYEDPQREKWISEERRIRKLLEDKERYPDIIELRNYSIEPSNEWKLIASNIDLQPITDDDLRERYCSMGNKLAEIHRALLGASLDYPDVAEDINTLVKAGSPLLSANSKETIKRPSFGTSSRSVHRY